MQTTHYDHCPICQSAAISPHYTCKDYYVSGEIFHLFRCDNCSFLFTQDAPSAADIGSYYHSESYISHSDTQKGLMNKLYHKARQQMLKRKRAIVERHAAGTGRILDYGTGTGYFAQTMQTAGWQVEAIEKDAAARDACRQKNILAVYDEHQLKHFPDNHFNVITLWHVLEHIEDLDFVLQSFHRQLDKGVLILALPNPTSSDAKKYKQHWAAFDVPRHLWHFTPAALDLLLSKHGFSVEKTYPMPLDAFYISMLSERYKGKGNGFLRGMWNGLTSYFASCGRTERSSSLIYIVRKIDC